MSVRILHDEPAGSLVGRALLLPGANYTVRMHGLFWPTLTLLDHGWRVTRADWDGNEWGDDREGFIRDVVERLDAEAPPAPRTIVVTRSLVPRECSSGTVHRGLDRVGDGSDSVRLGCGGGPS
jgi:hypothetical protein